MTHKSSKVHMSSQDQAKYTTPLTPLTLEELQNLEKLQKKFEKARLFF